MKRLLMFTVLFSSMFCLKVYARGSGEIRQFTYYDNGIYKNVSAEYIGTQDKRMYISGSGRNARIIADVAFKLWNGSYGEWEQLLNQSYPNATPETLAYEAMEIQEIMVAEMDNKRYILELVVAQGKDDYFWWDGNELHLLQRVYQIK